MLRHSLRVHQEIFPIIRISPAESHARGLCIFQASLASPHIGNRYSLQMKMNVKPSRRANTVTSVPHEHTSRWEKESW